MKRYLLILVVVFILGSLNVLSASLCPDTNVECNSEQYQFATGQGFDGCGLPNACGSKSIPQISEVKLEDSYYKVSTLFMGNSVGTDDGFLVEYWYAIAQNESFNSLEGYALEGVDSSNSNAEYFGNGVWRVPVPTDSGYEKMWVYIVLNCINKEKCNVTGSHKYRALFSKQKLESKYESDYKCSDTDGGINQYENGITTGAYVGDAKREIRDYFDYCVSLHGGLKNGILSEAFCEDGLVKTQWIDCDYGCSGDDKQGVCLKQAEQKETKEDLQVPIVEEPKVDYSENFEQNFMLLNQKDNDAIKEFINKIGIEKWHILVNHGRFRAYYALRDSLRTRYGQSQGDAEFDRLYGTDIIDLKNFPNIFNYGGTFNGVIVIGEYATDKEKEVARYLHTSIKNFFSPAQNWPMEPIYTDTYLYKDNNDFVRNIISIGSPCNNKATAEIIHTSSCDSGLKEGESKIQLWDNDDFAQLAIVANSDEDLMIAAKYLVEHLNNNNPIYTDEKFKGKETILGTCDGCFSRPDCILFFQRVNDKYCDSDKKLKNQKQAGDSCTNKYECVNNICKNNICKPYCEGCYNEEDNCVPIGTRSNNTYCNISQEITNQEGGDSDCNNNYECSSNVCVNNKCISPSLLQKIIEWFKKLFG